MRDRILSIVALALAGCAPSALPAPRDRVEACGRLLEQVSAPGALEFCDPSGVPCAPDVRGRPQECVVGIAGYQPFCYRAGLWSVPAARSNYPCSQSNGGIDCPAWWTCERQPQNAREGSDSFCVPALCR